MSEFIRLFNAPTLTVLNLVAAKLAPLLSRCRQKWWQIHQNTGLDNKWLDLQSGVIRTLEKKPQAGALYQITKSVYDPNSGRLTLDYLNITKGISSKVDI